VTAARDTSCRGVAPGIIERQGTLDRMRAPLKEVETDATKRALTTFGNLFGLALYDMERRGLA
jgi:hypothetical protein